MAALPTLYAAMFLQLNPLQDPQPQEPQEELELAKMAPTSFSEAVTTILESLADIWSNFLVHVPYVLTSFVVLLVTWIIALVIKHSGRRIFKRTTSRKSLRELLVRLINIGVWVLGFLFAAMVLFPGLTPARALGALGLLSVAVGLAFKDIFENFFAGILILWRFPFEEGDFIECEGVAGRVEAVEVRNTAIRKTSGELVIVPNLFLFKNPCEILTDRIKRRVAITVGVAYREKLAEAVEVIEKAVASCELVREDDPIQVFPQEFGDSGIDIEVTWWTGSTPVAMRKSRGEVVTAIKDALDSAGIEIPFPYRTLTFKEPLSLRSEPD
ncbi:mechanosensitive ion channel family protein [Microbulbifer rhizosphaerae]|uniref:Small-conductance mechanosensitive channel n=1 Tax=Microbulbifer rhizosphaerae TaxID=1562603 RepID=A0A7W4WFT6_9GAMM|nr:mechanosensitive ion channel family protein [Microbulbifer rhizosphaerae]MBB3063421.1 small-conductance mechanosensitive channel [Microbulbifer rhizosphaerae]